MLRDINNNITGFEIALQSPGRLLFISVNGPEVQFFAAEKYAQQYIKSGCHSTKDLTPKGTEIQRNFTKIFQ